MNNNNNNNIAQENYVDLMIYEDINFIDAGKNFRETYIDEKKFIYHFQLFALIDRKKNPEIIINYIYKNLYELINESELIDRSTYMALHYIYSEYYIAICEQPDIKWFKTLFPPIYDKFSFSFKSFYVGLVGRVINFSFDTIRASEFAFYWYGDPKDWSISYHLYINSKNEIEINKCKFLVIDKYKMYHYNVDLLHDNDLSWDDYVHVLYKHESDEEEDDDYEPQLYDEYEFNNISCRIQRYAVDETVNITPSLLPPFPGISVNKFNDLLINYKINVNRASELSEERKEFLDKERFNKYPRKINSDNYSFYDFDKWNINDYEKEIRHLGYNEELHQLWNNFKLVEKKVAREELNRQVKLIKDIN